MNKDKTLKIHELLLIFYIKPRNITAKFWEVLKWVNPHIFFLKERSGISM